MSGKGGSGKTTVAGTLARLIGRSGTPVLAIDGDPNPNLALTLGLSEGSFDLITPLPHGLLEHEKTNGEVRLRLKRPVAELTEEYAMECSDGVRLMVLGPPSGAGTG